MFVQPAFQRLQRVLTLAVGVFVELGLQVRVRDDDELGVHVHPDAFVEFDVRLVGHVQQLLEQVSVLGGVLDDGQQAVALGEDAVVAKRLWVLAPPRIQFAEHAVHPRADEPLLGRPLVLGVQDADAVAHVHDEVLHPEVSGLGDRREQVRLALPAVLFFEEVVGLPRERVEFAVDADRDVVVEALVDLGEQIGADVVGEHRQRVGLDGALVPVVLVLDGRVPVGHAGGVAAGPGDVPLDGVAPPLGRLRVLPQAVDETAFELGLAGRRRSFEPDDLLVFPAARRDRAEVVDEGVQHLGVAEDGVLAVVVRIVEEAVALLLLAFLDDHPRARVLDGIEQVLRGVGCDLGRFEDGVDVLREAHRGLVGSVE